MKLRRLVELVGECCAGADEWPVMFTVLQQNPAGEWKELDTREPITTVRVDGDEIVLIHDSAGPPLTVSSFNRGLADLLPGHSEFEVDTCEPKVDLGEGVSLRLDFPIVGVGRDDERQCLLLVFASKPEAA
jgi:hypothetical protein